MNRKVFYSPVSEALAKFKEEGFTADFNLQENCIVCTPDRFEADDFEIVAISRYEGDSDPADEATVYAIESSNGMKGTLVTGYGVSSDTASEEILKKLHNRD